MGTKPQVNEGMRSTHSSCDGFGIIEENSLRVESREQQMAVFERSARAFEDIADRYGIETDCSACAPMTDEEVEEALYRDYLAM